MYHPDAPAIAQRARGIAPILTRWVTCPTCGDGVELSPWQVEMHEEEPDEACFCCAGCDFLFCMGIEKSKELARDRRRRLRRRV